MKEILVLCPFGVDKGLLSKAARLSERVMEIASIFPGNGGRKRFCRLSVRDDPPMG